MLEPRGDDAIVHVRLDPGGGLRPHGPPAIEERCSVDAATDGGRVFVPRNELMHRKEYR